MDKRSFFILCVPPCPLWLINKRFFDRSITLIQLDSPADGSVILQAEDNGPGHVVAADELLIGLGTRGADPARAGILGETARPQDGVIEAAAHKRLVGDMLGD